MKIIIFILILNLPDISMSQNVFLESNEDILEFLSGENSVQTFHTIQISNNTGNEQIDFSLFDNLKEIKGSLIITNLNSQKILKGFKNLKRIRGTLTIGDNKNLEIVDGFENLSYLDNLEFYNMPKLSQVVQALNVSKIDAIYFEELEELKEISFLKRITKVDKWINITNCKKLINLDGFENIESIGTQLRIGYNENLLSLEKLNGLKKIGGSLWIENNTSLESIGWHSKKSVGDLIKLDFNPKLEDLNWLNYISFGQNAELEINGCHSLKNLELDNFFINNESVSLKLNYLKLEIENYLIEKRTSTNKR